MRPPAGSADVRVNQRGNPELVGRPLAGQDLAELAERYADLAERYVGVTRLPDDVEALWRAYHEQQRVLLGMAVLIDRLDERIGWLERRERRQARNGGVS